MAADGQIIIDTQIDATGLVKGTEELEAACKRAAASVGKIGDKAQNSVQKSVNAITKQNQAYAAQEKKVEAIRQKLTESTGKTVMTDEYKALNAEAEKLSVKLAQLDEKKHKFVSTGGDEGSKTFRNMEYDADRLIEQIERLKSKMDELKASGGAYTTADTTGLQSNLITEQQKLAQMGDRLSTSYSDFAQKVNKYGASASSASGSTSKLSLAVNTLKAALSAAGSALKKVVTVIGSALKKALSATVNLAKKAGSALKSMGKSSDKAGSSLKNGIKTMLKYGFGIRSLYALVNKLRSALVTGMENLAQYSNKANNAISSMQSAIARLQNSIAAAFSPILATVAPVVTQLINLLADAISYIGAFFAALSGSSTYTKAVSVQKNYAASLADTASAASGAADAMQDYLSGLDEITKLEDNSSSGGGGGGSGGGGSSGVQFEEASIPGIVTDWAEKFKAAWENANFTEIGTTVGAKLKNALEDIPWNDIQKTCNKIAQSVATFINGFVATPGLWVTVGQTIGNGINTAVGMYNKFMDTVNFRNIGSAIATTLNNAINTTDWSALGKALTQKLRAAIDTLYGFVTTFDWSGLGTAFAYAINGAINNITFSTFGSAVANLVNGLVATIGNAVRTVSWSGLGTKIANGINNAIRGIDWSSSGATIGDVLCSLVDFFVTIAKTTDWEAFGQGVGNAIESVLEKISDANLAGAISPIADALVKTLSAAIKAIDWLLVGYEILDGINSAIAWGLGKLGIDWTPFDYSAGYLEDKAKRAGETSGDNLVSGLKSGSGGGDLSTKLGTIVTEATGKFDKFPTVTSEKSKQAYSGALSAWDSTSTDYEIISTKITSAFSKVDSTITKTSASAYSNAKKEWNSSSSDYKKVSKNVSSGFDNLASDISKKFNKSYTSSTKEWKSSSKDFKTTSSDISKSFSDLPTQTQKYFTTAYGNAKKVWSSAPSYFKTVATNCANAFSSLPNAISSTFTKALSSAKSAWSGAGSTFSSISKSVVNSFSNLSSSISKQFTTAYSASESAWSGASSNFSSIANSISSAFSGVASKIPSYFKTAVSGITNLGWWSAGKSAAQSVVNGMYNVSPSYWCSWFMGRISLDGSSTGYYLTRGIINGMYTTAGLGSWASWFIYKVKQSLGVHSPSKLFRDEVGYYLGAGISVGLKDSTSTILKTVSGLADKIADGFQDGLSGVTLPTLTASSIFPDVTLRTPLLATGTVIPPKATASSNSSGRVSDVLEQLQSLLNKWNTPDNPSGATTGNVIHNVIQINRRTLYEEMVKEEDLAKSQSGR